MSDDKERAAATFHPSHHWGPFADDPWSPILDLVDGRDWNEAVRRSSRMRPGLAGTGGPKMNQQSLPLIADIVST